MPRRISFPLFPFVLLLLSLSSCNKSDCVGNVPAPVIESISPASATAGGAGFTLTVTGRPAGTTPGAPGASGFGDFQDNAVVRWNGSDRPTRFQGTLSLEATISAADIAAVGTAQVTVFNPGGSIDDAIAGCFVSFTRAESNAVTFTINAPPAPGIARLASWSLSPEQLRSSAPDAHFVLDARGNVYRIQQQTIAGRQEIWYARSSNGGATFSAPLDLRRQAESSALPPLALRGTSELFVLWPESPGSPAELAALLLLFTDSVNLEQGIDRRSDAKFAEALAAMHAFSLGEPRTARLHLERLAVAVEGERGTRLTGEQAAFLVRFSRFARTAAEDVDRPGQITRPCLSK